MEEVVERDRMAVELVSRVQIRAVLSGLAVGAGVFALCMGFSWAIGLSTFRPTVDHARGLALGNMVWGAIALWISIFFGGYVAALVGRSPDARSGILHGVVVWGATAALLGLMIVYVFGGLLGNLVQMSEAGGGVTISARGLEGLRKAAGLTVWLYWAGIAGGFFTSLVGGFFGARSEIKGLPRRQVGVRVPVTTGAPEPA